MVKPPGPNEPMINFFEELSMNAWPSLQTVWYDGWVLRFAAGYTRRANSVNILHSSRADIVAKIRYCEELYGSKGQDTVFKMTPVSSPETLDSALAELSYSREAPTSVLVMELDKSQASALENVLIDNQPTDKWLAAYCRLSGLDTHHLPVMARLLNNIVPAKGFFSLRRDDKIVATGLAVVERGYVGLFDIVVAEHSRNQGLGMLLVSNMLRWGITNGANHAYLQVMHSNAPALHLYGKLGFREAYTYWYRVKGQNSRTVQVRE